MKERLKKYIKIIKELWESLDKKDKKIVIVLISIILLSLLLKYNNPSKSQIQVFVTTWTVLFLGWFVVFDYKNVEKILLERFTQILFGMIVLLFLIQGHIGINNRDILFMMGAIFAFWYGYKKYERNQEIRMIETLEIQEGDIRKIILDWKIKRVLYQKGYIKSYLWEIIEDRYGEAFYRDLQIIGKQDLKEKDMINEVSDKFLIINRLIHSNETNKYFKSVLDKTKKIIDSKIKINTKLKINQEYIEYLKLLKQQIK